MTMPAAVIVLIVIGLLAGPARAVSAPDRTCGLQRWQGKLAVSVGLADLFAEADTERLRSGLTSRVRIRVYLYRQGSAAPVAQTVWRSEIIYDLWEERFRVRITGGQGPTEAHETGTIPQAVGLATSLIRFPVADLAELDPGASYQLRFRADLNPVSQELVGEVRRWLAQPPEQGRSGPGDRFFGSFVSVFVNPIIEDSERQLRFDSQTFTGPPR